MRLEIVHRQGAMANVGNPAKVILTLSPQFGSGSLLRLIYMYIWGYSRPKRAGRGMFVSKILS